MKTRLSYMIAPAFIIPAEYPPADDRAHTVAEAALKNLCCLSFGRSEFIDFSC